MSRTSRAESRKNNEILRNLMVKFKNDEITNEELEDFRQRIDKLLWKTIHSKYCTDLKEDVYQEVWRKLTVAKVYWREDVNVYVSTWLWRVAISAIGDLRYKTVKRKGEISLSDLETDDESSSTILERIIQENKQSNAMMKNLEKVYEFVDSLAGVDRCIVDLIINPGEKVLAVANVNKKHSRSRLTKDEIMKFVGLEYDEFCERLDALREKFYQIMNSVKEYEH